MLSMDVRPKTSYGIELGEEIVSAERECKI
jgi:hypothetical protein